MKDYIITFVIIILFYVVGLIIVKEGTKNTPVYDSCPQFIGCTIPK